MAIWAAEIFLNNLTPATREALLNPTDDVTPVFGVKRRGFDELFVLVTDSQFVVYCVGETIDPLLNFFLKDPGLYEHVHFYKTTEASINHLFATASGLCSDLKGGRRVEGQIKRCHQDALAAGGLGLTLDSLVRQSLRVGRKVKAATGIGDLSKILIDAGMEIVFSQTSNPVDLSYLVLGRGDIASSALEFFYHGGFRNITIASEDEDASQILADKYGIKCIQQDQVETFIQFSDVIISEDSIQRLFPAALEDDMHYGTEKIFLDFGNDTKKDEGHLRHYTIEDINNLPTANANVFHSLETAWQMVESEGREALRQLSQLRHVPVLASRWPRLVGQGEQEISLLLDNRIIKTKSAVVETLNRSLLRPCRDINLSDITLNTVCTTILTDDTFLSCNDVMKSNELHLN